MTDREQIVASLGDRPIYSISEVARFLGKARTSIPHVMRTIPDGKRRKVTQTALIHYLQGGRA